MGRPSRRTSKSYDRDIESLTRLRMALMVDRDLRNQEALATRIVENIDNAITGLREVVLIKEGPT